MSSDDAGTATAAGEALGVPVDGEIRRLNPQDGLFLKAEHLDGIQDHAEALSHALGTAYGNGVVHGYGLGLEEEALVAGGGLAVTRTGVPLLCAGTIRLPLDDEHVPDLDDDGYWLVVLEQGSRLSGNESVYGSVCADPCDGGGTLHPWLTSTVVLRLRARTMPGLDDVVLQRHRRNFLASGYFEQERREALPWTLPRQAGAGVPPLLPNPWDQAGLPPDPTAVPIGVLLKVDGEYVVDPWTARREVGGPPAAVRWAGHLGMRTWPAFLAQLLQFMQQLQEENLASGNPLQRHKVDKLLVVDEREHLVEEWVKELPPSMLDRAKTRKFVEDWGKAPASYAHEEGAVSLPELGFDEIPPGGYLAPVSADKAGLAKVERLFAGTVTLRYCEVRADAVVGAIEGAQHLDRIPLRPDNQPLPEVDILVPSRPADLDPLRTDAYGWVAFVRRAPSSCEEVEPPQPPEVEGVDVVEAVGDPAEVQRMLAAGDLPDVKLLTTIDYEKGKADLPPDQDAPPKGELTWDVVLGTAETDDALELAKRRLEVLVKTWGLPDKHAVVVGPGLKSVVVLLGHRDGQ